jgi:hypothetical protein
MNVRRLLLTTALIVSTCAGETDPPIACNMKALTSQQRKQLTQLGQHVISAIDSSRELKHGYTFHVDPAKASLKEVAEWLDVWRRCCPFYEFQIDFHAADASLWLAVKGRPGVKEYIPFDSPLLATKLPTRLPK